MPARHHHRLTLRALLAAAAALVLLLGACGSEGTDAGGDAGTGPRIVVTTTILGDLVERLVEGDASVEVLMPPGADPHDYELSAAQSVALRQADLVVVNGLGLEERVLDVVAEAEADGVAVVEVAPQLDPEPFTSTGADHDHDHDHGSDEHDPHEHAEGGDGHDHEGDDPHVWLDPDRMARGAELLAVEVAEATGLDAGVLEQRAATYAAEARAAGVEADEVLAVVPADQRVLVTNHEALGYFARRFDLRTIGVVIPGGSTLAEPSAADIAELARAVRDSGVGAIFAENTVAPTVIEAVAREAGGDVVVVELATDSLGEPGSPTATYAGMIVANARAVADGLTGAGT